MRVYWQQHLDGGGRDFGLQFVPVVENRIGPVRNLCEVCSGPGFIGFSLLQARLCETLCLVDINPEAIDMVNRTIRDNGLGDRVRSYVSDGIKDVPGNERWDLVVGNAPHFCGAAAASADLIRFDPEWRLHEALYRVIGGHLKPHGSVLMIENWSGSEPSIFARAIDDGGLEIVEAFMLEDDRFPFDQHYFLWTRKRYETIISETCYVEPIFVRLSALLNGPRSVKRNGTFSFAEIEICNDLNRHVRVGIQTVAERCDRIIDVRPGARARSGKFISHAPQLYVFILPDRIPVNSCTSA
jgi:hypothetical protein